MANHITLKVYAVEVVESLGRDEDYVTLEFDGTLKKKTKDSVETALATGGYQFRFTKKVLA
jgi:hypothetical protein